MDEKFVKGDTDDGSASVKSLSADQDTAQPNLDKENQRSRSNLSHRSEQQREFVTGIKLWLALASITLVIFLMLLDMSIIVTAIPSITNDFHSLGDVGWYGSAFLLANCAVQPLAGRLYTIFNSKYTFLGFLLVFEVGSVICGSAQSSIALIIGRAIAGLGGSGLVNGALTISSASAPKEKQPMMVGIMMGISQIGVVSGPLIGGALTERVSWRWCFYINLPIGAAAVALLLLIQLPDHRTHDKSTNKRSTLSALRKLDLTGFVLFAGFAIMMELALSWGGTSGGHPWNSALIIGLFCGGASALIVFVLWELRMGDGAMIPPSIVRRREVWSSALFMAFFSASMLIFSYYMPIYFQAVKGVSALSSGVYMLAGIGPQILMAVTSGAFMRKTGFLPWALASSVIVSLGAGLTTTLKVQTTVAQWVMYQFVAGLGRGCGMQTPVIAVQQALQPAQIPLGMSLVIFMQTFGGSLFLTLAGFLFEHELVSGLAKYAPTVNGPQVIAAGATAFREVVSPAQLSGVLRAYAKSIGTTFYLAMGASAVTFFCAWGMKRWRTRAEKDGLAV